MSKILRDLALELRKWVMDSVPPNCISCGQASEREPFPLPSFAANPPKIVWKCPECQTRFFDSCIKIR